MEGYRKVSEEGVSSLTVESISRAIQKNKSSFYHYFGDLEVFESELLAYHLERTRAFAQEVGACETILPGLIKVFLAYKTDIFFHQQLRFNRENPTYKVCFEQVFRMFEEAVMDTWIQFLGLEQKKGLARTFLHFISENFLLKITQETFTEDWLKAYIEEVVTLLQRMNYTT